MGVFNSINSKFERGATIVGNKVFEAASKDVDKISGEVASRISEEAAKKGYMAYDMTKNAMYGAAGLGTFELAKSVINNGDPVNSSISGAGLGAIGGAGATVVASAIAKGFRR